MTGPDYQNLIDTATWGFIRATEAAYPPDTASLTIAEQRGIYDGMCRIFHRRPPETLSVDKTVAGVPCRHYPGASPLVIYLHGGGFVVGGLHSHDDICADIRAETGLGVLALDYRLSPEHLHPAAYDDVMAVVQSSAGPLILVGDSAGANLAAAVCHGLRGDEVAILGQVLIYPGLGGDRSRGSYITHAHAPMLTLADVEFYAGIRHGGGEVTGDPTVAPLQDTDFSGLPPTAAIGAQCDPLCDDARDYAAAITAAGGRAQAWVEPGLVHGYLRARHSAPRAAASFARICNAISTLSKGQWPEQETP